MASKQFPQIQSDNTIHIWACSRVRDKAARPVRSGIGVWLGSKFKPTDHLSEPVDDPANSCLRSEIRAGIRALEEALIKYARDIEDRDVGQVAVHTDSAALADAAVIWIPQWQPRYMLAVNQQMVDKKLYERLSELIGIFHVQGLKVFFNIIGENDLAPAADLAATATFRQRPYLHNRDAWIVDFPGKSVCHDRDLFVSYKPTLLARFDNAETFQHTTLVTVGRGTVHIEVVLCNGRKHTIVVHNVFHVPDAPINIFVPERAKLLRRGFLIHGREGVALVQDFNRQTVLKLAAGPKMLYPEHVPETERARIPSKLVFMPSQIEPSSLPDIPLKPRPRAYRFPRPIWRPAAHH